MKKLRIFLGVVTMNLTTGCLQAVERGCWVLIEDLDLAPLELLSSLIPLLETGVLINPSRDHVLVATEGFKLFGTRTTQVPGRREGPGLAPLLALCVSVPVEPWSILELQQAIGALHSSLGSSGIAGKAAKMYESLAAGKPRRRLTTRDAIKFAARCAPHVFAAQGSEYVPEEQRER